MSRHGKIARLPRLLRDELNQRLDDGQEGDQILDWINSLPQTQALLLEHFQGVPISKQNLSQWRQGGFAEWLLRRDLQAEAEGVLEAADDFQATPAFSAMIDAAAFVLAARFGGLVTHWNGEVDEKLEARARLLNGLCRSVVTLQRSIHQAARDAHEEQKLARERADQEQSDLRARRWLALASMSAGQAACQKEGDTPEARKYARAMTEIITDTFDYRNYTHAESEPVKPSQTSTPAAAASASPTSAPAT
jgi:hypothetical protein